MARSRIIQLDFVKKHEINFYNCSGVDDLVIQSTNEIICKSYLKGMIVFFIAEKQNTSKITLALDGLPKVPAKKFDGSDFEAGQLKPSSPYMFIYDGIEFRLLGSELSEITKRLEALANEIVELKSVDTKLEAEIQKRVSSETYNEFLKNYAVKVTETEKAIETLKVGVNAKTDETVKTVNASLEALKTKITDAFEKVGIDTTAKIKVVEESLKNDTDKKIQKLKSELILGDDFDPKTSVDYVEGTIYNDGDIVKLNNHYCICLNGELLDSGVKTN